MRIHLIQLFEETVSKYPQKTAVIDKDRSVTFSDLRQKAIETAVTIALKDIPQNRPIGVFLDKSVESVYADLGILYAGDFYMNLDIKTPAERIKNILQLVEPAAIISTSIQIKSIATIIPDNVKLILLDELGREGEKERRREGVREASCDSHRHRPLVHYQHLRIYWHAKGCGAEP